MFDERYAAYCHGGWDASNMKPIRPERYPEGLRREDYIHGYETHDPMGDFHGKNK